MANTTNTTSYLDPPSLIGRLNNDGTISLTPLELKRLNDFNYAVSKMIQGGLNLANLNADTNQVFTDIEGNVTKLQVTADGLQSQVTEADGKASSAKQTADGVQVEVTGLSDEVTGLQQRNTVTIDSTGLYVTNAAGQTTKLSGNQITSGTIEGVTLISKGTGATITISDGKITFSGGGGAASLTQTSRSGLYIEAGSVSGEGISISTDSFFLSANGGTSVSGPTSIEGDLTVARNINSSGAMKLSAGGNMSIDASSSIYIGGSNGGETIQIGTGGATINLIGDVTVNGVPYAPAGGGK